MKRYGWTAVASMLALAAGCGAKTGLAPPPPRDAGMDAAADATPDAPRDRPIVFDAPADAPRECETDRECDDGVACTVDICTVGGRCRRRPVDARCDDGMFCTVRDRCEPGRGCVRGARGCGDGVACTVDSCDEAGDRCVSEPDDSRCEISHACDPVDGCRARAFAHSGGTIYDVALPSGEVSLLGSVPENLTDMALRPDRTLIGIAFGTVVRIDTETWTSTPVAASSPPGGLNALDAAPDGTLYAGAGNGVYRLDMDGTFTSVASLPAGFRSSGDIAFIEGRALITATRSSSANDRLVEVDIDTGGSTIVGSVGHRCVWGLAAFRTVLYGLTCEGRVLRIDSDSGSAERLSIASPDFFGATAR